MHLILTPQRGLPGQPDMTIHVAGDTLTLNGTVYDLSAVPEGGEGWPEEDTHFIGPITRQDGMLHVRIVARLGDDADPHQDGPWVIEAASGDVTIPAKRLPESEETK